MFGIKKYIIPIIVYIALIATIGVGIYQLNSNNNPWDLGRSDIPHVEENLYQK